MNDNIKLNFIIKAHERCIEKYIIYECTETYNKNVTFEDILFDLYGKYSQYKYERVLNSDCACAVVVNYNLFDINYHFVGLTPEPEVFDYYHIPIGKLEEQFYISKAVFEVVLDLEIGGTVGEYRGINFFFHTNEKDIHHIPHIHCKYSGEEFRVNLITLDILDKAFKNNKYTKIAIDVIKTNRLELLRYWEKVVLKGESVKFKMYVPYK